LKRAILPDCHGLRRFYVMMVFHTQQLASNVGDSYIRFCSGTYRTARPSCRFKLTSFPIAPLLAKGPEQLLALPWFEDSYFVYALNLAPSVVALDSNDGCKTDVGGRSVVRVSAWRLQGIFLSAHRAPFGIAANVQFKSQRGSTASFPLTLHAFAMPPFCHDHGFAG
jgi:hypothetical protein